MVSLGVSNDDHLSYCNPVVVPSEKKTAHPLQHFGSIQVIFIVVLYMNCHFFSEVEVAENKYTI